MCLFKPQSKALLVGTLLVIALAFACTAFAEGMRPFRPLQPEEFGGQRRDRDGVYGSVEGFAATITMPTGNYIGRVLSSGKNDVRWAYNGSKEYLQTNTMSASMFQNEFSMGTRVEIGNRQGHHGWLFSGYGVPQQTSSYSANNVSMVIGDPENIMMYPSEGAGFGSVTNAGFGIAEEFRIWNKNAAPGTSHLQGEPVIVNFDTFFSNLGYFWGFFPNHVHTPAGIVWDFATLAPLPITFNHATITNRVENSSLELMYSYRAHPFRWGSAEFFAGGRYWDLTEKFGFVGRGPWYTYEDGVSESVLTGQQNVNEYGPVSVLAKMDVNARVNNRVIGPQIGAKVYRKNARWTFGMEGRFMAGINSQSILTKGNMASHLGWNVDMGTINEDGTISGVGGAHGDTVIVEGANWQQIYPWIPFGPLNNTTTFHHRGHRTVFAPIVELRFDAEWQWTDAVSVNFGFTTMFADGVGRAVRVTDYKVDELGNIFGIRKNINDQLMVYGVNFGVKVTR